ncbi:MAG: hydrogenase maturation nickel metallochaperone HypA/HybF [Promethearchaeota archaeon]|jgi:hydrogenase nickel incorporation protein HypA/HybF
MHEFSVVSQIFKKCLEVARQNNAPSISEINLEVGDFALIVEEYAQKAFDTMKKGSIAENATLNIKRTPGVIHCNSCQQDSEIWFNKEKEQAASEGRLEEYENYKKNKQQVKEDWRSTKTTKKLSLKIHSSKLILI